MDTANLVYIDTMDPTIEAMLEWMARQSQSCTLDYGEDTGAWECSWILRGERYTAVSPKLRNAVWEALVEAGLFPLGDAAGGNQYIAIYRKPTEEAQ
jgi:hypothetical protein